MNCRLNYILAYNYFASGQDLKCLIVDENLRNNCKGFVMLENATKDVNSLYKKWNLNELTEQLIADKSIDKLIFSSKPIPLKETIELINHCHSLGLKICYLNQDLDIITLTEIEFFGNPEQIAIDFTASNIYLDKTILITGAAGSIGRQLSLTLSKLGTKKIILVDIDESGLFKLKQVLGLHKFEKGIFVVADISDLKRMDDIFKTFRPDIVVHAAAYKHVPLMESHPHEVLKVNIKGTKVLADLAVDYLVESFLFISTDKAVNPTSLMGASKRIAEIYTLLLHQKFGNKNKFLIARFGNVLGSNGSVVPLFRFQLNNEQPLSITDRHIERFFITPSKACELIIESLKIGLGGELFIFEMGQPIQIHELAKAMVALSGKSDVKFNFTGLRPGEKFMEELIAADEHIVATLSDKIYKLQSNTDNLKKKARLIDKLCQLDSGSNPKDIVSLMKLIVPEFKSQNSEYEALDISKIHKAE